MLVRERRVRALANIERDSKCPHPRADMNVAPRPLPVCGWRLQVAIRGRGKIPPQASYLRMMHGFSTLCILCKLPLRSTSLRLDGRSDI